jgi:hypothetical protein
MPSDGADARDPLALSHSSAADLREVRRLIRCWRVSAGGRPISASWRAWPTTSGPFIGTSQLGVVLSVRYMPER